MVRHAFLETLKPNIATNTLQSNAATNTLHRRFSRAPRTKRPESKEAEPMGTTISTVKETCPCGATFEYSGDATEVLIALARFQKAHESCRIEAAVQVSMR